MARVVGVLDDLFFGAKILAAAKQVGIELELMRAADFSPTRLDDQTALVIFDLNAASANPVELIRQLKNDAARGGIGTLGFVSHVQVDLQRAATQAGCDQVLPRSQFSATLPALLRRYVHWSQ